MSFADREDEVFHFSVISDPLFSDKPNETSEIGDNFFLNVRVYFQPHSLNAYIFACLRKGSVYYNTRPTIHILDQQNAYLNYHFDVFGSLINFETTFHKDPFHFPVAAWEDYHIIP